MISIPCSACGRKLKVPPEYLGRQVNCPACKARITLQAPAPVVEARPAVVELGPAEEWSEAKPAARPVSRPQSRPEPAPASSHPGRTIQNTGASLRVVALCVVGAAVATIVAGTVLWGLGLPARDAWLGYGAAGAVMVAIAWSVLGAALFVAYRLLTRQARGSSGEPMLRDGLQISSVSYVCISILSLIFVAAHPSGSRPVDQVAGANVGLPSGQRKPARQVISGGTPKFHPRGMSETKWRMLERLHHDDALALVVVNNVPSDRMKLLIQEEVVAGKSWREIGERDKRTLEIVIPVDRVGWPADGGNYTKLESVDESSSTITLRFDREKTAAFAPELANEMAAEKLATYCRAPENIESVKSAAERHTSAKVAFVEVVDVKRSQEDRNVVIEALRDDNRFSTIQWLGVSQVGEAVYAPVDDLKAFAAAFDMFEVISIDPATQRIKIRPDFAKITELALKQERKDKLRPLQMNALSNLQMSKSESGVLLVLIDNSSQGVGLAEAIARLQKGRQPERATDDVVGDTKAVFVTDLLDLQEFAAGIDFATVTAYDRERSTLTIDLDKTKAQPMDLKKLPRSAAPHANTDAEIEKRSIAQYSLNLMRKQFGAERVLVVTIKHTDRGIRGDEAINRLYGSRRRPSEGPRYLDKTMQQCCLIDLNGLREFAAGIDFAVVTSYDAATGTLTIDLDKRAKPMDLATLPAGK